MKKKFNFPTTSYRQVDDASLVTVKQLIFFIFKHIVLI